MTGALAQPAVVTRTTSTKPFLMMALLVVSDTVALVVAVAAGVLLKILLEGHIGMHGYVRLWPFLFVFIAFYAAVGLYSGAALSPPEELRRATFSSAFLFPTIVVLSASWRGPSRYITPTLFVALIASIILVPLCRALLRQCLANKPWWGYPTVIFGDGETATLMARTLIAEPGFGLRLVAVFDKTEAENRAELGDQVAVLPDLAHAAAVARNLNSPYAVIAMPSTQPDDLMEMIEEYISPYFSRILLIPNLFRWSSLWIKPKTFGDILGLEVVQQSALPDRLVSKRVLDLLFSTIVLIVLSPILAAIALAIRLESRGPAIFGHTRIGQNGCTFRAWKFRTMVLNGDQVLEEHLRKNPAARAEWEQDHKLRKDPRVTRVGRFLRKTSLDELPQLWNVLTNDMSLVGPRPIVEAEIPKYGNSYSLYTRVKGGVTGLWQVSGRNDIAYEERVKLDSFYVRNWSVWLDLCILYRTIGTVLFRSGAY
ncbi:MAG TPA: undecaprenyl-phosphate galactose phosphotransferase WbaP [Bryobacteraceae bacterium]|nr:undecaprenyl-phosphate galactose phosphotransferase WbaP [Bryobacteraceae bacterium]